MLPVRTLLGQVWALKVHSRSTCCTAFRLGLRLVQVLHSLLLLLLLRPDPGLFCVISPDFSLELTRFFSGKHLIHFLVLKMKDFRNFVLDFDAEQVYLKLQVTNLKNKEVTVNLKPHTLEKNGFSKTLNPKP